MICSVVCFHPSQLLNDCGDSGEGGKRGDDEGYSTVYPRWNLANIAVSYFDCRQDSIMV